ncbi:MAG: hypothetical protein AAGU11_19015 [Syntrophobacteraceae bacterium]
MESVIAHPAEANDFGPVFGFAEILTFSASRFLAIRDRLGWAASGQDSFS